LIGGLHDISSVNSLGCHDCIVILNSSNTNITPAQTPNTISLVHCNYWLTSRVSKKLKWIGLPADFGPHHRTHRLFFISTNSSQLQAPRGYKLQQPRCHLPHPTPQQRHRSKRHLPLTLIYHLDKNYIITLTMKVRYLPPYSISTIQFPLLLSHRF
jgi:hypothetical protein